MVFLGKHAFEGPFASRDDVEARPGLFAIVAENGGKLRLIDLDEAGEVHAAIANHPRQVCWRKQAGTLAVKFAVLYSGNLPVVRRRDVVAALRGQ